ncbi:MAG: small, acid-soluble spore protein, alpha/beta type [Firmicutes bacterium]|nr:small, acid-soluble spore protein, alpha/beta type [Bacillota bacterium]
MSRHASLMSDELKLYLADQLGVGEVAREQGFGELSARNCGNLVKQAILLAQQQMAAQAAHPPTDAQ